MPDPVIDRATLDTLASTTDKEFVGELIDTFLEDAPSLLDSLMTTLAAQDAEGFRRAAHSLKSNGASLGAMSFSASAKELEMIGKAGDLSGAEAMVESLRAEFEQVTQALKDYKHEA
ncbi:MAG TPA: Hpt domain-containing protein [Anaerolineales bacterium]|nr:Hpt domain-containing protein [Anaerolineales bacterium]